MEKIKVIIKDLMYITKELTKLIAQFNKLSIELVSLVGWILIIIKLLCD